MNKIFILGTHRTGTKTLNYFFNNYYKEVNSFHQFNSLRLINIFSNCYLANKMSENIYKNLIKRTLIKHIRKNSKDKIYIIANGFNYLSVKFLKDIYDDIKVVHIIRDPRDFVVSYINFIANRWQSWVANNVIPFWNINGYEVNQYTKIEWKNLSQFEHFCWLWKFKNELIMKLYSDNNGNYFLMKLETLNNKKARKEVIERLLNFVGLEYKKNCEDFFDRKYNFSKNSKMHKWIMWDSKKANKLNNICGELMRKYNYGHEKEWIKKLNESNEIYRKT